MQEKKYGIYNTFISPEKFDLYDEIDIWKKIENFQEIISDGKTYIGKRLGISVEQLEEAQYNMEYLIYYTRKFGVEFDCEPSSNKHIEYSESFLSWYNFWDNHFSSMSKDEYYNFLTDKENGNDISKYLPDVKWNDNPLKITKK